MGMREGGRRVLERGSRICCPQSRLTSFVSHVPARACLPLSAVLSHKAFKLRRSCKINILAQSLYLFTSNCVSFKSLTSFFFLPLFPAVVPSLDLLTDCLSIFCLYPVPVPCLCRFFSISEILSHSPQAGVSKPMLCIKGYWKRLGYPRNEWGYFPHETRPRLGSENKERD